MKSDFVFNTNENAVGTYLPNARYADERKAFPFVRFEYFEKEQFTFTLRYEIIYERVL